MLIQKEVLRDKICDLLRGWILDGTLKPGERIVELSIAKELNVSRAPLREALWLLARQGLVEIRAHHGATVTQLSEKSIREIFEVRELLETHVAKRIRENLNNEVAAALKKALAELKAAAETEDMARFSDADLQFHQTLWKLAGNRHLEETLEDVSTRFFGYVLIRNQPSAGTFQFDAMVKEHAKMVNLILKGTDRELEAGYKKIFAVFLNHILAVFAGHGASRQEFFPDRRIRNENNRP